ncbi:MAG: FtsW/RodA/SpoVE family cell cycle protein [Kosmotogaceae bacterium]
MTRRLVLLSIFTSFFIVLGFVFVYSAGLSMEARLPYLSATDFLLKQLIAFWLGIIAAIIVILMKAKRHFRNAFYIYYPVIIGLLAVVLLSSSRGGSHRWIDFGFMTLQVSEFAKIILILVLARYLAKIEDKEKTVINLLLVPLLIVSPIIGLTFLEPDLSTSGLMLIITFVMLFIGGLKFRHVLFLALIMLLVVVLAFQQGWIQEYQLERITSFFSSEGGEVRDQIDYSLMAISNGELVGTGLGLGIVKYYIPVSYSDFIFATIGEELGFIGLVLLLLAYLGFLRILIIIALKLKKDIQGRLYILGFGFFVAIQASINIAVNLGLFPPTGLTLPFVSYGGSSLLSLMFGLGLVLSIIFDQEKELYER